MPKIKISQLPAKAANLAATDLLEVSEVSGLTYVSKKITGSELVGNRVPYTGATTNVDLGEYELKAGQLTLDVSPTGTAAVGTTRWNDTLGSSETTLKGGSVILKNGVDLVARVVNKVSPNTTLTKATYPVVKVSGAQGQRLAVAYAQADSDNNSADTLGVVTETIATNQEGFILTVGQLEGINTTGSLQGESWADGHVLYLSPTIPGGITNIKPNGSTGHIVVIGYVEHSHAINGKIYVKIMNGWELDELHNVYINTGTLVNDQVLTYESATQLWKNKTPNTGITVGTTSSSGTNGRVFFQAGGVVQQDGAFNWDNTNKRLGIGTTPSTSRLNVLSTNNTDADMQIRIGSTDAATRFYTIGRESANGQLAFRWGGEAGALGAQFYFPVTTFNTITSSSSDQGTSRLRVSNTGGGRTFALVAGVHNSTQSNFSLYDETAGVTRFIIDGSGNLALGTGTTTPGARLDVRAADGLSNPAFRVQNSVGSANIVNFNGNGQFTIGLGASVNSTTLPEYSVVIGHGASDGAAGNRTASVAIGRLASGNYYGVAVGTQSTSSGDAGVAIGASATAGTNGSSLGYQATAAGSGVSIGKLASSTSQGAITIGTNTINNQNYSVVFNSSLQAITNEHSNVCKMYFNSTKQSFFYHENGRFVINSKVDLVANTNYDNTATNTVTITNGTAPTLNIVNSFQQYSADITADNAAPHFRTENGSIIKLYQNAAVTNSQGVADALTNLGLLASSTIAPTVQSVASAATVTPTFTNDLVKITAQAVALTLAAPTGTAIDGKDLMIRIKDNGTAQTIAWTSGTGGYRAIGVTLPTTTTAGKTTYVGLIYNSDDSIWDVIGVTTQA